MNKILDIILVILSSALMGLSQQPINLGFLSLFALVPILHLLCKLKDYREAIKIGLIWGIVFNTSSIFWISQNIGTSPLIAFSTMLLAVFILTTIPVMVFIVWCRLNRRGISIFFLSFIWPSIEFIRSFGSLAFPWVSLSNSLIEYHLIIQSAEYIGMYGMTFWVVLVNIMIYQSVTSRKKFILLLTLVIITLPSLMGNKIIQSNHSIKSNPIRVASIQPNVHLSEKWSDGAQRHIVTKIISQTKLEFTSDGKNNPDLVVWPETSTISYILKENNRYNYNRLKSLLKDKDTKLIAGIPHYEYKDKQINYFNSAGYFDSSGLLGLYHKINLVPGAEYVPLSNYIRSLDILNIGIGNFTNGKEFTLFNLKSYKIATMICFESVFPGLSREFVRKGANLLVYIVNDGWYESAPEPQQHASRAIYRAIETRRPVVRCANTGISMVIDEFGNIQHQIGLNKKGTISAEVYPTSKMTFYVKYGDIFIYFMIAVTIIFMFRGLRYEEYI